MKRPCLAAPCLAASSLAAPACLLAVLLAVPATAAAPGRDAIMLHVDPAARVEQRCNARAMGVVEREQKGMRPDEMVAYAFADPQVGTTSITAPGAAIRSAGHWYRISYRCRTTPDGMDVVDFSYQLGAEVPKQEWSAHSLVP